jgi:hypothetical protein
LTPASCAASGLHIAAAPPRLGGRKHGVKRVNGFCWRARAAGQRQDARHNNWLGLRSGNSSQVVCACCSLPMLCCRPRPTELYRLLDDATAAAVAAAVLAHGAQQDSILGSCEVLSPVRARRHVQQTLGASEQVRLIGNACLS